MNGGSQADSGLKRPRSYIPGKDPQADALYTTFFLENHLDHYAYPDHVATPEQVRFMVFSEDNERYYPCSDEMFWAIMSRSSPGRLKAKYKNAVTKVLDLVEVQIDDPREKAYLKALIEIKFDHETRDGIMIPSRLEKRLLKIYMNRTQIEDPFLCQKAQRNARAARCLASNALKEALDRVDDAVLLSSPVSLEQIKERVDHLKLSRLFALSVQTRLWESEQMINYTAEDYLRLFSRPVTGDGADKLWRFLGVSTISEDRPETSSKKILWLTNEAGEIMADLAIIRYLAGLGHKIIIAFKGGPWFTKVDYYDAQSDEYLAEQLQDALLIDDPRLGKNRLVEILKTDKSILAISDGTLENLNLLMASTTFARAFKEVDGVISKGHEQRHRLFDTHFQFTRDIYSIAADETGGLSVRYKPRHPAAIKFTLKDLENKARTIIAAMQTAKKQGMTVMFYSGIIGSIPGKEAMAKDIMNTTVRSIKDQSAKTFVINPSEHSEPGMDADDLMFMWEIAQRSGLIDIWRFQTYDDIIKAFEAMKMKVPPEWVGKDATFSTGCTKEMKIALEVQKQYPEMQIIGPAREKFLRRQEYGIGKMYDRRLQDICEP